MRQLLAVPLVIAASLVLAACSSKSDTDNASSASSNVSVVDDGASASGNLSGDNGVDAGVTGSNSLDANVTDVPGNAGEVTGNAP